MEAERERLLKKIERLRKDLETTIEKVGINSVLSDKAREKLNTAKEEYNIFMADKAAKATAGGRRRKSRKSRKSRKTRRRRT